MTSFCKVNLGLFEFFLTYEKLFLDIKTYIWSFLLILYILKVVDVYDWILNFMAS